MFKRFALVALVMAVAGAVCAAPALAHKKKVKSEVTIEFSDELSGGIEGLFGEVKAKRPCGDISLSRAVTVFGNGVPFGTDTLDDIGWLVTNASGTVPPGSYYATVGKNKFKHAPGKKHKSVCKPGTSPTITVP